MIREALAGFKTVRRLPWLAGLESMALVHTLVAVGPWMVLLPVYAVEEFGGVGKYGLLLTAFFVGGIPGAMLAGRVAVRTPGVWALVGISQFGVLLVCMSIRPAFLVVLGVSALAGAGTQFFDVCKTTAIQSQVEPVMLGRVFSLDFFASFVTMPLGQLAAGLFIGTGSTTVAFGLMGVLVFASSYVPLLVPGTARFGVIRPKETTGG